MEPPADRTSAVALGAAHATEVNHSVFQAWETFPLWDTARRAVRHIDLPTHAGQTAEMMTALTRSPHTIRTPGERNC